MAQQEQIGRAEAEQNEGVAVEPIEQPLQPSPFPVFANREQVHVTDAACVQIAGGGMMERVRAAPAVIRRQREHAESAADPVIAAPSAQERTVPAIVLDDEQPEQEQSRQRRHNKRGKIASFHGDKHQGEQSQEG